MCNRNAMKLILNETSFRVFVKMTKPKDLEIQKPNLKMKLKVSSKKQKNK